MNSRFTERDYSETWGPIDTDALWGSFVECAEERTQVLPIPPNAMLELTKRLADRGWEPQAILGWIMGANSALVLSEYGKR